mmetsp:Transcript_25444/g.61538  ORF Transcript_25444/g.61538 Transcript_25444/m.61538 type:complete len:246 (+) Transcript_25444:518-1255(+)
MLLLPELEKMLDPPAPELPKMLDADPPKMLLVPELPKILPAPEPILLRPLKMLEPPLPAPEPPAPLKMLEPDPPMPLKMLEPPPAAGAELLKMLDPEAGPLSKPLKMLGAPAADDWEAASPEAAVLVKDPNPANKLPPAEPPAEEVKPAKREEPDPSSAARPVEDLGAVFGARVRLALIILRLLSSSADALRLSSPCSISGSLDSSWPFTSWLGALRLRDISARPSAGASRALLAAPPDDAAKML